jgi:tight adherence protein C
MGIDGTLVGITLLLAGGLGALGLGVAAFTRRPSAIAERLAERSPLAPALSVPPIAAPRRAGGVVARILAPVARAAMPMNKDELQRLRLRLQQGGIRAEHALTYHVAAKMILAVGGLGVFLWVNAMRANRIEPAYVVSVLVFASGFYLPELLLSSRITGRQSAIERGLPDALDLLVTCVEAGLGLDAAIQRVSDEVCIAWPLLGEELRTTFLEVRAGIPRTESFRRLAARTGVGELKSLSATLTQTEIFGTSVAVALRIQAEGIRLRRMQRAEERAAYVSVKMTVPLILCILPSLFAIILGPAALSIAKTLLPMMGGAR